MLSGRSSIQIFRTEINIVFGLLSDFLPVWQIWTSDAVFFKKKATWGVIGGMGKSVDGNGDGAVRDPGVYERLSGIVGYGLIADVGQKPTPCADENDQLAVFTDQGPADDGLAFACPDSQFRAYRFYTPVECVHVYDHTRFVGEFENDISLPYLDKGYHHDEFIRKFRAFCYGDHDAPPTAAKGHLKMRKDYVNLIAIFYVRRITA